MQDALNKRIGVNLPPPTDEEKAKTEAHYSSDVKLLGSVQIPGGIYTVAFQPNGQAVAAAGEDGKVRIINASNAALTKEFIPVPIGATAPVAQAAKLDAK